MVRLAEVVLVGAASIASISGSVRNVTTCDTPFGLHETSERRWVEVHTYRDIHDAALVDWPTLGMIAQVMTAASP